jgi:hypothetical protein
LPETEHRGCAWQGHKVKRSHDGERSNVWWFHLDRVTSIGRTPDHLGYVFPDLTSTAHIKLNCKLKLLDRTDPICSRAPENFLSGRQWQGS